MTDGQAGPEFLPDIVRQMIRIGVVIRVDEATAKRRRRCRQKFRRPPLVAFRLGGILLRVFVVADRVLIRQEVCTIATEEE